MYVCLCNSVTDSEIKKAIAQGASSLEDLQNELGVAVNCGRCGDCARKLLEQTLCQSGYCFSSEQVA